MRENRRELEDQISNFNIRKRGREKRKWEEIISEIIKENLLDLKHMSFQIQGHTRDTVQSQETDTHEKQTRSD